MNWRLLFSGTQSTSWTISVIVGVCVVLVVSYWLLKLERRLVPRTVGYMLLSLRLFVLLTLLTTFLKPVLTRTWDAEEQGRLVVAIDVSQSMETEDQHATLAEKLRWAQALGMLGNEASNSIIEDWIQALDAGNEPNWLGRPSSADAAADREMSLARKRQISEVLNEFGRMKRTEFVHRLLTSRPGEVLTRFSKVMPLDIRLFATQQETVSVTQLPTLLSTARPELIPSGTDPATLLTQVLSEPDGNQVRGIVLFSDGRPTVPGDLASEARRLGSLGVPVHTVPIGSRFPPRDLSIAAVESPETVFVNDSAQITATIGASGFEGQEISIRLEKNGQLLETQKVTPAGDTAEVRFSIPPAEPGRYDYQLITESFPGELREDNNKRELSVSVVDTKARVLLIEGDARWEFRYLKNLLERDQQVELSTTLFRQPYLSLLNETFIQRSLPEIEQLKEQLANTDLVVIGDAGPVDLPEVFWTAVEESVSRDGLTVVVIPGRRHMPQSFTSATLQVLLPVEQARQRWAEQLMASVPDEPSSAFQLHPTSDGSQLPMFQLGTDQPGQIPEFQSLPGHPWAFTATARPSATVWADVLLPGREGVTEPAIVHHYYGFGQVLWMGIDSTWRWRQRAGDSWHYRFWGQLVRWAARNKASAGNDQVRLTLSNVLIDETESAEVVARWNEKLLPQLAGATLEIVATPADLSPDENGPPIESHSAVMQQNGDTPERFTARLPRLPPGNWNVELKLEGAEFQLREAIRSDLMVRPRTSAELANVSCNREALQQLADLSGGQMVEPSDLSKLISLIQPEDFSAAQIEERTLWDHWGLMLVFFFLLMCEWVIRKLNGLP
ncbi:MAG: hypothetical protein JNL58_06665 [Planctomyces sp.]|nr:hypothetical protein [Planctomyces sp.]